MKFVALVSGGKDSCFNILQCIANQHELVALANLHPPRNETHEMDSYMYQTVGHNVVAQYSDFLGVPLYRRPITGLAVTQKLDYSPVDNDETEDLFQLLKDVLSNHPDIEAVSVGAILSSYQRTRVENVCQRLGLVSLSYLWQRDQVELLDEIIKSQLDARIIKVAGMGLKPNRHIGQSLADSQRDLLLLHEKFGLHPCGEGGEYETLVLGGPSSLFKKKIAISNMTIEEDKAEVGFAKLDFVVEDQEYLEGEVVVPNLLDAEFEEIEQDIIQILEKGTKNSDYVSVIHNPLSASSNSENTCLAGFSGDIQTVMKDVCEKLKELGMGPENVTFCSLILSDMADFVEVNKLYTSFFTTTLPPARVCISARLAEGTQCQLSLYATSDLENRSGLHVQSRSYWAPANIGPYSQAISSGEVVYLSGQIPLIPATMEMVTDPPKAAVLSLQHLVRVSREVKSNFAVVTCFTSSSSLVPIVEETAKLYFDKTTPVVLASVVALPRNAPIEWTALGYKDPYYLGQREDVKVVQVPQDISISSLLGGIPPSDVLSVTLYSCRTTLKNDINTALENIRCTSVRTMGVDVDVAVIRFRKDVEMDSD